MPARGEAPGQAGLGARDMARIWLMALGAALFLASPAGAKDWQGAMLPDQPTQFIFGYGSLINSTSRNATVGKIVPAIPVRVSAAVGYIRAWDDRSSSGFTALGLRKPGASEKASTINGVLYPVDGDDMAKYDIRERGYRRVEVPRDDLEAMSWQLLPATGRIWVYIPVKGDGEPGVGLPAASAQFPLLSPMSTSLSKAPWNMARPSRMNSSRPRRTGATTGSTIASSRAARGFTTRLRRRSMSS